MLWVALMVIAVVALICEYVEGIIEERQDSKCDCDTCPMRYECRGCNK